MIPLLRSYARRTWTAQSDSVFLVIATDLWLNFADIFVYDNPAYLGDVTGQDIYLVPGDTYTIPTPVNMKDFFFKNAASGSNTRIVISGTPMTKKQADNVGIVM